MKKLNSMAYLWFIPGAVALFTGTIATIKLITGTPDWINNPGLVLVLSILNLIVSIGNVFFEK